MYWPTPTGKISVFVNWVSLKKVLVSPTECSSLKYSFYVFLYSTYSFPLGPPSKGHNKNQSGGFGKTEVFVLDRPKSE